MKVVCETERLIVRRFNLNDAGFIVRLLNEESFIRYIADKHIKTKKDAVNYLNDGPISSYQTYGFGLNLVILKETHTPIGMCGLLKREELDYPDLGYAFLPEFCGKGYASEAAISVLNVEMATHQIDTVLAVTLQNNVPSIKLLNKAGFNLHGTIELYGSLNDVYEYRMQKEKTPKSTGVCL